MEEIDLMRFLIIMLVAMIAGGAIATYVDDKLLRPVLIGLFVFSALFIYFKKQK